MILRAFCHGGVPSEGLVGQASMRGITGEGRLFGSELVVPDGKGEVMNRPACPAELVGGGDQAERERKTQLLNILTISGGVVCLLFLVIMYLTSPGSIYLLGFWMMLACCVVSWVLTRVGRVRVASLLYTCSLALVIFLMSLGRVFDGVVGPAIYYLLVPVLVAGMVIGPMATFGFATLDAALIAVITVVARRVLPYDPLRWDEGVLAVVIPATILCYVMAVVAWLYGRSLERALRRVTEQGQQLWMANEEISAISRTLEEKVTERTQELRDFVSIAAHDLRNPLTVIRGITELLLESRAEGADQRRNRQIGLLAANVDHMLDLTDNLLDISRLHEGSVRFDMEALPIQAIIEEVCAGFEGQLVAKGLGLKVDLPPDLVPVWGDRLRLTQVLNNLVANAYHYTPAGAIIVNARHVDHVVEVSVSDTGIGISSRDQKRLFAQFFRGEHAVVRSTKGTGLGLAISRAIVEGHDGEMSVESELGRGSTFRFTVPVAPNSPAGGAVVSADQSALPS